MFKAFQNMISRVKNEPEWFSSSDISYEEGQDDFPTPEHVGELNKRQKEQWEGLLRGQIVTTTSQKLFNYITLADQKAQMIIILNSIMIPLAISVIDTPEFKIGATIAIVTGMMSILLCIICIYPKRRTGRKPDGTINHLHFADIGRLREQDYMERFRPIYNDKSRLAEEAIKDIHDVSRRILLPKFRWLKLAYVSSFLGYLGAILYTLFHSWSGLL